MPEQTDTTGALSKVEELNKLRGSTYGRLALGLPGMSADIGSGMSVAQAMAAHFPQRAAVDGSDFYETKADLLAKMSKLQVAEEKQAASGRPDPGARLELMEMAADLTGKWMGNVQRSAEARQKAINNSTIEFHRAVEASLALQYGEVDAEAQSRIGNALASLTPLASTGSGVGASSKTYDDIWKAMSTLGLDLNGQAAYLNQVSSSLAQSTENRESFDALLEEAAAGGDTNAQAIVAHRDGPLQKAHASSQEMRDKAVAAGDKAMISSYHSGGLGDPDKFEEIFKMLQGVYHGEVPDDAVDDAFKDTTGQEAGIDPLAQMDALLKQFQKPSVAPNLAEARKALLSSDEFQAYMAEKGYQPGQEVQALRNARTDLRDKKASDRIQGAKTRAANERGLPVPSDSARLAGGTGSAERPEMTLAEVKANLDQYKIAMGRNAEGNLELVIKDPQTGAVKAFDPEEISEAQTEAFDEIAAARVKGVEGRTLYGTIRAEIDDPTLQDAPSLTADEEVEGILSEGVEPKKERGLKLPSIPEIRAATTNILLQGTRPLGETVRKVEREVKPRLEAAAEKKALKDAEKAPGAEADDVATAASAASSLDQNVVGAGEALTAGETGVPLTARQKAQKKAREKLMKKAKKAKKAS